MLRPDARVFVPSVSPTASIEKADKLPRDDRNLINKVIKPDPDFELQFVELKKLDDYGYIYEARQLTTELLFEIKVYCFNEHDGKQTKYVKRNFRELKSRRRCVKSWKENGLVFLILRYPKLETESSPLSDPSDGQPSSLHSMFNTPRKAHQRLFIPC